MKQPLPSSQGRSRIKSIISNAGWLGLERMVRAATSFLVVVWIARTLGPEMFGALNFAQSIVIGLVPLVTMGLNPVLVRDLVQQADKRDALLASAALLRLGGALILMLVAQTLAYVLSDHDPQIMWLVAIIGLGVFAYAADGIDCDYQARMQNKAIVLIKLIGFVICTLLKIVLIVLSAGVEWFAAVMTLESLLIALMMWRAAHSDGFGFAWFPSESMIRSLITQATPMFLVALLANLFGRVDQVLLGSMAGYETLGSYAVAWKIVEMLGMFPYFAVTALAPALSALHRESQDLFKSRYLLATRILFWSSILVCIVLNFALPEILPWVFGPRYADAIDPLKILLWVLPMIVLGHMTFQWVLHMGGMRFIIVQGAFMLLVGTILCWFLIGPWGQVGAAVGILVAQLLANLLYPLLWPIGRRILAVQCQSVVGWRR